jgi:hypothetical protein
MNRVFRPDPAAIVRFLKAIMKPGQVTELRIIDAVTAEYRRPHIESGFFDDYEELAKATTAIKSAKAFWIVPNPINPDLKARASNRIKQAGTGMSASDKDIQSRHWLLIDVDPERPAEISSSDAEHDAAIELVYQIRAWLSEERGWPDPIVGDSGNGCHLMYPIDLPADDGGLVHRCLEALAAQFGGNGLKIDSVNANLSRAWKLYGTPMRKGDDVSERPHRMAAVMELPEALHVVQESLLKDLAKLAPKPDAPATNNTGLRRAVVHARTLEDFVQQYGLQVKRGPEAYEGGTKYLLAACPFDPSHTDNSAIVGKRSTGELYFNCSHNSCNDKHWDQLKDLKEPGWRDVNASSRRTRKPKADRASDPASDDWAIVIDPIEQPVCEVMAQITNVLLTGGLYQRADQTVTIRNDKITPILDAKELTGVLNQYAEVCQVSDGGLKRHVPLPTPYANMWLNHPAEQARLPAIALFTRNPVLTQDWRIVQPGFDRDSGCYYAGPKVEPRDGTEHLDALLADFCWRSPGDRTNYVGMLLTTLLVGKFIGSKPGVVFSGSQPGVGKSILAQIIGILRDGHQVETVTFNPNDEELEKRLGSLVRRGLTTIIIDNAKTQAIGRRSTVTIESACLERCITDAILSFRHLGFSADVRAENSHIFAITANTPQIGRDLVTRCVVVNLEYEGDVNARKFSIADPEGYAEQYRMEVLGELLGMIERWKAAGMPLATTATRFNKKGWGNVVGGILHVAGEPDFLANADEVAAEMDVTRRDYEELVKIIADNPRGSWSAGELAGLAIENKLFRSTIESENSKQSQATSMGFILKRFSVMQGKDGAERIKLDDGRSAAVYWSEVRNGKSYVVYVE